MYQYKTGKRSELLYLYHKRCGKAHAFLEVGQTSVHRLQIEGKDAAF